MTPFCLAFVFFAQTHARDVPLQNSLTVGLVLDRWEAGVTLIENYDLRLVLQEDSLLWNQDGKVTLLEKPIQGEPSFSRIYRKGEKRRGEFLPNENGEFGLTMIWGGARGYVIQRGGNTVTIEPELIGFEGVEREDYESTYRTLRGTIDRVAISKQRRSRLLPREGRLYIVDVAAPNSYNDPNYTNMRWRVWLDPDRNFMPVKMTDWIIREDHEEHNTDVENELAEVSPGVWAIVRSTIRVFAKGKKNPIYGKFMGTSVLRVIMDQSKFNGDPPDELFEAKVPLGATVVDRGRNVVYTAGSENADAYLAQLAQDEKAKLKKLTPVERTPPQMVFIPDDDWPRWAKPLLIGAGAASALLAIVFVIRIRARRAP